MQQRPDKKTWKFSEFSNKISMQEIGQQFVKIYITTKKNSLFTGTMHNL